MHIIKLNGYNATVDNGEKLELGTFDSYGEEQLQIIKAPDWENLSVIATFNPPNKKPVQVVVDSVTGVIKVPKEATADLYGVGTIVFVGLSDGVQRISADVEYIVRKHSNASGTEPAEPTPDLMQQVLTLSKDAQTSAKNAEQSAKSAAEDAAKAGPYAKAALAAKEAAEAASDDAQAAARAAKASETAAAESASNAAESKQAAAQAAEIAQQAAEVLQPEVNQLKEDLATKIDKPSTAPEVGKILKVTSVNADGTFVCEWANDNSGAVDDVQINNVSIVQDGVAKIPVFSNDKFGVVKLGNTATSGIRKDYDGTLVLSPPTKGYIDVRFIHSYGPIIPKILDYAVKKAMCDGLGEAWTDAERIAALLRMGCTVDDNGFVKWTAQEVAE